MNTKGKVKFWLKLDANLRDSDSRLCANIWAKEIIKEKGLDLLTNGKKIDYEGASDVTFTKEGDATGSFLEQIIKDGKFETVKQR